jgi:hypothetical protein
VRPAQRTLVALLLSLGANSIATGADLEVSARLEPEVIGIEQMATLTIEVQGDGQGRMQADPEFQLENLEVVAGPYSQQSFQFVNGTTSRSATISWRVRALDLGTGRVHSIRVRVGDQVAELADLTVTVQSEPVEQEERERPKDPFEELLEPFRDPRWAPSNRSRSRGEVFLKAAVSPVNPYVGQQALYTLYLYTQSDISSINPESLPDFQGFWVREVPQPKRFDPEMVEIDGKTFARVKLLERAIFPLREGDFTLEPTRALMAVKVPVSSMRLSLLSQTEEIQRVSNPVELTVRPLPAAPPNYSGAVGDLTLTAKLEPATVKAGEAATLSLSLEGRGLLQALPDPQLPVLDTVEIYPPQQLSQDEIRSGQVFGEREWHYVLVPDEAGSIEIPSIEVPFFDSEAERYRMAATEALRLTVLPSARVVAGGVGEAQLHPIRSAALPATGTSSPWRRALPHTLVFTALLGFVATWVTRHTGRFTPEHRAALHRLERHLDQTPTHERPRQAAAELEEAWRTFLRDRWDVAPGTPSTQWREELERHGAHHKASEELERMSEDLHYLRYAPQLSSTEALQQELVQRSRQILKSLH